MNRRDVDGQIRSIQMLPGLSERDRAFLIDVVRQFWREAAARGDATSDDPGQERRESAE